MRTKNPQQADKILDAAARLFATHRFHEARMEDIAALAEVGKGTLYRYFDDKEKLYLALLDRAAKELQDRIRDGVEGADEPRGQLIAVVEAIVDYFDAQPHLFDLIQHAEAMQRPGQQFPWQKTRNQTMQLVKGIFDEAKRQRAFAVADPELAVLMLLGGVRAVVRFGKQPRPVGLAGRIVEGFLEGYGGDR